MRVQKMGGGGRGYEKEKSGRGGVRGVMGRKKLG